MNNLKQQQLLLSHLNELLGSISDTTDTMACIINSIREEHATDSEEEVACAEGRILEEEQKRFQQNYDYEKLHHMTKYHLDNVQASTGEITVADYEYCTNLTQRIIAYQSSKNVD